VSEGLVIETADLRKRYDGVDALRGLDLQVPRGSIYGFLGPNGAGKTTTLKILLGMTLPTAGHARVFGLAAEVSDTSVEIRRRTAFVSDDKQLYDYMTVDEIIRFTAAFYPRWRADLEERYRRSFDLPTDRKVKTLSRGMRTKLALLLALSRGAELLMLDEPTSGLDPTASEQLMQALVGHVASEEMTVFFSSHQIAEIEQVADSVAIIDRGRAVVTGAVDDLRGSFRRIQLIFDGEAPDAVFRTPGVKSVRRSGRVLTIFASGSADQIVEEAQRFSPISVDALPVTLKDIFLETVAED
jgi:ABC-2 type transport system ATP-binding protein